MEVLEKSEGITRMHLSPSVMTHVAAYKPI